MERNTRFILGGILVVLSLPLKDLTINFMLSPPLDSGGVAFIIPLVIFLALLVSGLNFIAQSIFEK